MSPSRKRRAVQHLQEQFDVSERRACRVVAQPRATQRYSRQQPEKDKALVDELSRLALKFPRFGYRRATQVLRREGWKVNTKRVQRLRRELGLHVRPEQRKRRRLGHGDNACALRTPEFPNHVWSVDFVSDQTDDGRRLKILAVIDEFTRRCLSIRADRSITAVDVRQELDTLIELHGPPQHIRSDNGPEFVAYAIQDYLVSRDIEALYIEPGSPWQNGYVESFNARFRDEILDREVFGNLREARVLLDSYKAFYNRERPHSALNYLTPNEFAARSVAGVDTGNQSQNLV